MKLPPARATVRISGEIVSGRTDRDFVEQLRQAGPAYELRVQIDSVGGDVAAACNMLSAIRQHEHSIVTTVCVGQAASAACLLFLSGDRRQLHPDAALMLHKATTNRDPNKPRARRITEDLVDILAARTGQDWRQCSEWIDRETWFDAGRALRFKLATGLAVDSRLTTKVDLRNRNLAASSPESALHAHAVIDRVDWERRRMARLATLPPATGRSGGSQSEVYVPPMPQGTFRTLADAPEHIRRQHSPTSFGPGCWRAY